MGDPSLSKKVEEEDNPAAAMEEKRAPVIGEDHSASGMETETIREYDIVDFMNRWSFENIDEMGDSNYFTDTDDEHKPPKGDRSSHNAIKRYYKQLKESQGYDICPPSCAGSVFMPRSLKDKSFYARAVKVLDFAMYHINSEAKEQFGKYYESVSIEKAVETCNMSLLLTFKAKEFDANTKDTTADAPIKILQTRVWAPTDQEFEFDEWRFKPAMGDHAVMEEKGNAAAVEEKDKLVAMKEKDRPAAMEEKETLVPLVGDEELDSDMESETDAKYIPPNGDSNLHNDIDVYDTYICSPSSFFIPRSLNDEVFYARAREVLNFAIEHINYETIRKVGKRYEFVSIEKAVETRSMRLLLTFKAKELDANNKDTTADAPIKILQTKVWAPTYQEFMFNEWRFKPDHAVMEEKEKLVWVSDEEFNSDTESDSDIEYIAPNPATHGYDAYMLAPGLPYIPQSLDSELFIARAHEVLEFAIGRINAETIPKDGKRYEFVSIEKGVESRTLSLLLTFKAKELDAENKDNNADAPVKILQTTVWAPPYAEFEFLEWRFKPGTT